MSKQKYITATLMPRSIHQSSLEYSSHLSTTFMPNEPKNLESYPPILLDTDRNTSIDGTVLEIPMWNFGNLEGVRILNSDAINSIYDTIKNQQYRLDNPESVLTVIRQYNGEMQDVLYTYFAIAYLDHFIQSNQNTSMIQLGGEISIFIPESLPVLYDAVDSILQAVNNTPEYLHDMWALFFGAEPKIKVHDSHPIDKKHLEKHAGIQFEQAINLCYVFEETYWNCLANIRNQKRQHSDITKLLSDSRESLKDAANEVVSYAKENGLNIFVKEYLKDWITQYKHLEFIIPYEAFQEESKMDASLYCHNYYFVEFEANVDQILGATL